MKLYRFISLAEFLDIVLNRRMKLSQIDSWDDKYETATLNATLRDKIRRTVLIPPPFVNAEEKQKFG